MNKFYKFPFLWSFSCCNFKGLGNTHHRLSRSKTYSRHKPWMLTDVRLQTKNYRGSLEQQQKKMYKHYIKRNQTINLQYYCHFKHHFSEESIAKRVQVMFSNTAVSIFSFYQANFQTLNYSKHVIVIKSVLGGSHFTAYVHE